MLKLTTMGKKEVSKYGGLMLLLIILLLVCGGFFRWLVVFPLILLGFVLYFFRDPERKTPEDPTALISPADGTITHIEKYFEKESLNCEVWRVSIFLSIFNVHLNRAPFTGTVKDIKYKKGEFLDVRDPGSLERNEYNTIVFNTSNPKLPVFAIKQIAGLIARRIVCIVKPGDQVNAGTRIGMMKFSSRTDLLIPVENEVVWNVKIGDKVEAGATILGKLV